MRYKLIDSYSEVEEGAQFGTCELCMFVADLTKNIFVFEDENGEEVRVEGGYWNWGDYEDRSLYIENIVDFADYVSKLDIGNIYYEFDQVIDLYLESREISEY